MDNFFYLSSGAGRAEKALEAVQTECSRLGLPTHEAVAAQRTVTILDCTIDGERCEIRPAFTRVWRLWLALDDALERGRVGSL